MLPFSPATILKYYWRTIKVMSIICEHGSHIMVLYFQNIWSGLHFLFRNVTLSYPLLHLCKSLVELGGNIEVSFLLCLSKSHSVKRSKHVADVKRVWCKGIFQRASLFRPISSEATSSCRHPCWLHWILIILTAKLINHALSCIALENDTKDVFTVLPGGL